MDKVLILDGQSPAATECVLALAAGSELHLATATGLPGFPSRLVSRTLQQPDPPAVLRSWVEALFRDEGYRLVIPSTEVSLYALKSRDLDPALRARMVIPDEESIDLALDKFRTVELAKDLGVPVPATTLVTACAGIPAECVYPVVIKPLRSVLPVQDEMRSFDTRICEDESSRALAYAELLPCTAVVEQEYFRGYGIGIEMLFEHGDLRWWFAHERIHALPVTGGASTYRRSIDPPGAMLRAAESLLSRLRWHGVAMVEFKQGRNGDFRLMEINPRLWGSLPLAVGAGANFPAGLLRLACGESPGGQPDYRRGLYMRHAARDLAWFAKSWRDRRNPLQVRPLRWRDCVAPLRLLYGSERWDFFRWRYPSVWWTRMRSSFASLLRDRRRSQARKATDACWARLRADWRTAGIRRVLVLCYGNICRSPVVERLLSAAGLEAKSAGFLSAGRSVPPDWAGVVENLLGIGLTNHRSTAVNANLIEWADLILLMDAANWHALSRTHPDALDKAVMLGSAGGDASIDTMEIRDPFDLSESAMRAVATTIKSRVDGLLLQRQADSPAMAKFG